MSIGIEILGIVAVHLIFIAWREYQHDKHIRNLEAALAGKPIPKTARPRLVEKVLRVNQEIKRENPKRVELDVARNSSEAMEHMRGKGLRFTQAGPVIEPVSK